MCRFLRHLGIAKDLWTDVFNGIHHSQGFRQLLGRGFFGAPMFVGTDFPKTISLESQGGQLLVSWELLGVFSGRFQRSQGGDKIVTLTKPSYPKLSPKLQVTPVNQWKNKTVFVLSNKHLGKLQVIRLTSLRVSWLSAALMHVHFRCFQEE